MDRKDYPIYRQLFRLKESRDYWLDAKVVDFIVITFRGYLLLDGKLGMDFSHGTIRKFQAFL